jgi:hypothetical protein
MQNRCAILYSAASLLQETIKLPGVSGMQNRCAILYSPASLLQEIMNLPCQKAQVKAFSRRFGLGLRLPP